MPKFNVSGRVTVSAWTTVEADSAEQAREIAEQRGMAQLVHQALYPDDDESWHIETDGEPEVTEVTLT